MDKSLEAHGDDVQSRAELAARYTAFEESLTIRQTIKMYWRSILWVLYGMSVVFGYGIDGNVAANLLAIPRFRMDYGEKFGRGPSASYIIPAWSQSLFSGISQLCAIIGALGTGWLADVIGRKYTTLLSCVISIGGVAAQFASNGSLGVLTAGKAINGFPTGMWLVLGPLYASEVAALKLRGSLISMTNIIQLSGVFLFTGVAYCLGSSTSALAYRIPLACQWIIPGLVLLTILLWPESPVWLVRRGRREAAIQSIRRLYGTRDGRIDCDALLAHIEDTIEQEQEQQEMSVKKASYRECFSSSQRRRTLVCILVYACQYLSGVVLVQGYQTYVYELLGYSSRVAFLLGILNIAVQWVANIGSWFLMTVLGRRSLVVWGQLMAAVSLFIIGGSATSDTQSAHYVTVAFMFIWGIIYQCTLGAAAWVVVGELPVLELRSRTQGLANMSLCFFQWLISFVFPYMFNPDMGNLQAKTAFVFGGTTFIGFLGTFFFLPETKAG